MTDKVGCLARATTLTGTVTAYTVPSGHTARVQIMYRGTAGSNSTLAVKINEMTIFTTAALTAATISYSTNAVIHKNDAAASIVGSADTSVIAPFVRQYMLDEGDTVQYVIGTADFTAMDFQVVGAQILTPTS